VGTLEPRPSLNPQVATQAATAPTQDECDRRHTTAWRPLVQAWQYPIGVWYKEAAQVFARAGAV